MIRGGSFVVLMCKCIKCIDLICRGRISFSFLVFTYLQQLGQICYDSDVYLFLSLIQAHARLSRHSIRYSFLSILSYQIERLTVNRLTRLTRTAGLFLGSIGLGSSSESSGSLVFGRVNHGLQRAFGRQSTQKGHNEWEEVVFRFLDRYRQVICVG